MFECVCTDHHFFFFNLCLSSQHFLECCLGSLSCRQNQNLTICLLLEGEKMDQITQVSSKALKATVLFLHCHCHQSSDGIDSQRLQMKGHRCPGNII